MPNRPLHCRATPTDFVPFFAKADGANTITPSAAPIRAATCRANTPKHGSWLNMAEIELSVLGRQCLDRRIPNLALLKSEVAAWEQTRNAEQVRINWQFTTPDARVKLKRLYSVIEPINLKLADH